MRRNESEFLKRRQAQLAAEREEHEQQEAFEALTEVAQAGFGAEEEEGGSALPRELATAYYEETRSWMHRFGDVRSDKGEYFILHEDNPDAWRMKVGDLIQDVAISPQPYWEVIENDRFREKRVVLKPIGANPFLTGVGAGGARITKQDIRVLTGEYEDDRVEQIEELLNSGKATNIDQVAYILAGTVGVNFGPNGPQGGWYSATDTMSNRGGRKRMSPEEIVVHDAKLLRKLGFEVSDAAIDGEIPPYEWSQFVGAQVQMFRDWDHVAPMNVDILYAKVMPVYEAEGLFDDDRMGEYRREAQERYFEAWKIAQHIVNEHGVFSFEEVLGDSRGPLSSIIAQDFGVSDEVAHEAVRNLGHITTWELFTTPAEGNVSVQSIIESLGHKQSDVQMRNVARCIMYIMSTDDRYVDDCYNGLLAFIRKGHGHWLVNEQIINWAAGYIDNDEILIAAATIASTPIGR
jgi:hypothetical protein